MLAEARWLGGKGSSLIVISLYGLIIGIVLFGSAWGGVFQTSPDLSRLLQTSPDLSRPLQTSPDLSRPLQTSLQTSPDGRKGFPPEASDPVFGVFSRKRLRKQGRWPLGRKTSKEKRKGGRKEGHGLAFISSFYEV